MTTHSNRSLLVHQRATMVSDWLGRGLRIVFLTLAIGLAVWGGAEALWVLQHPVRYAVVGEAVELNRLAITFEQIGWVSHQHDAEEESNSVYLQPADPTSALAPVAMAGGGFAMPRAMMPGIPMEGQQRLRIEISLLNNGNALAPIDPRHFHVEDEAGNRFAPLVNSTFPTQSLTPSQRMGTVLFIDVDENAPNPKLIWNHQGSQVIALLNGIPSHAAGH